MDELLEMLQSRVLATKGGDPDTIRRLLSASVGVADVTANSTLSNLAVAYENAEMIADAVMPVIPVEKKSGDYFEFDAGAMFNMIDDSLGSSRGSANESDWSLTKKQYQVKDRALVAVMPFDTEVSAEPPLNLRAAETDVLMSHMALAREFRVASTVFNSANYGSNTVALVGTARWDDYTNSDPAAQIDQYLESPIVRPNVAIIGEKVWRALKQHPKMKELILSRASSASGSSPLRITKELFAAAFELDRVYVPRSRYNLSKAPTATSLSRIWAENKVSFIRVEATPNVRRTATFGYTLRFSNARRPPVMVSEWFDNRPGVAGVTYLKVAMSDDEKVVGGGNVGFFVDTVVS